MGVVLLGWSVVALGAPNVVTWGDIQIPTVPGPPDDLTNAVFVTGGWYHALALRADGAAVEWGSLAWGNTPPGPQTNLPPRLPGTNILAVAGGDFDTIALLANGTVKTWGYHDAGEAEMPPGLNDVVAVAAGSTHVLALKSDHSVVGWGSLWDGAMGYQETNFLPALTNAVLVAAGDGHDLALLADGTVVAWGGDSAGQTDVPPGLTNVVGLAAGTQWSAALIEDGTVVVWGDTVSWPTVPAGQVANVPADVTNVTAVAAMAGACIALRADGTVVAWGSDNFGERDVPEGLTNVVAIGGAGTYGMAVTNAVAPPRQVLVTNAFWLGGRFSVQVPTQRAHVYELEYKDSLADPQWQILPLVAGTGEVVELADPSAAAPHRFYRVRRW